jgi:diguanylate cyclase (GGDEF)-like protein
VGLLNTATQQRILLVDDSPSVLAIMSGILSGYVLSLAYSGEQAIALASSEQPDLILLDVRMPGIDGYETCRRLKQQESTAVIPIIFVTGLNEVEDEAQGFALGAVDFISKPVHPPIVRARVQAHLELKAARDQLQRIAMSDGLTGIANRRRFENLAQAEWNRVLRYGHPLSLLMIDVDDFKAYNDRYGHQAGDECLQRVAASLEQGLRRAPDLVARYGGEEFVCLIPELSSSEASALAKSLCQGIHRLGIPHAASRASNHVTASMGLATAIPSMPPQSTWQDLLAQADQALYRAKRAGRNRVETAIFSQD